jgi:lysophospholipase L1-like esterase
MKSIFYSLFSCFLIFSLSCINPIDTSKEFPKEINILFLGDSYTIGESVCDSCRYPVQIIDSLESRYSETTITYDIVAKTGWTTSNLLSAISTAELVDSYDYVYILIGVNNQYQNKEFSIYEKELIELFDIALQKVDDNPKRVNMLSIPDYAFTPFGQNGNVNKISEELDNYNAFAKQTASTYTIEFINITDISRQGIIDPTLVANDGLHPSTKQYSLWTERALPVIIDELF